MKGKSGLISTAMKQADYNEALGQQLGGTLGSVIGSFFSDDPSEDAMEYLNQIPETITPYYQPYIDAGSQALPSLQDQYSQLLNDPSGLISSIGSNYEASPGYQWSVDQATKAANQSAAAGGMLGSPAEQQKLAQNITGMANQDYYNYMNQALGLYGQGLSGTEGMAEMGYGASNELANSLAANLQSQAQLGYSGQDWENQKIGGIAGGLGTITGGILGGL